MEPLVAEVSLQLDSECPVCAKNGHSILRGNPIDMAAC